MAYYRNFYRRRSYINKDSLEKYRAYSYGKLSQLEKEIPVKLEKNESEILKLQNEKDKMFEKSSSIDSEITDLIIEKIGSAPSHGLSREQEIICIVLGLISGFSILYYYFQFDFWASIIVSAMIVGGGIGAIYASFLERFRDKDIDKKISIYNKKYDQLNKDIRKKKFLKLKLPINYFDKIDKSLEEKISRLRKSSLHLYSLRDSMYNLKSRSKRREERAKIVAYDKNAREGAQIVRSDLIRSLSNKKNLMCPYCENKVKIIDTDADHIHPINKGGLSTNQNMVLICKKCNSKKKAFTLRAFCKQQRLNYDNICNRLENMGKDV